MKGHIEEIITEHPQEIKELDPSVSAALPVGPSVMIGGEELSAAGGRRLLVSFEVITTGSSVTFCFHASDFQRVAG